MLYRYDIFSKEDIEYDTAPYYLKPLFKIGEVAKMLNRSTDTIRKYENLQLIDKAKQYLISDNGKTKVRFYTETDVYDLMGFFANRRSVGRPCKTNSKINQKDLMQQLNSRFQQIKNVGR